MSAAPLNSILLEYKMNETVNEYLLTDDKFISEMHLKQPGFTYSACRPFTKTKKELKNLKKQDIQSIFIKMNFND